MSKKAPLTAFALWLENRIFLVLETIHPHKGYHGLSNTQFLMNEIDKTVKNDKSQVKSEQAKEWSELNWLEKYTSLDRTLRRLAKSKKIISTSIKDVYHYQLYPTVDKGKGNIRAGSKKTALVK